MKKIILILCFLLSGYLCLSAYAARQVTWNNSKLIEITIHAVYTETGVTWQVVVDGEIYDQNGDWLKQGRLVKMRSELPPTTQAQIDGFVKRAYRFFRLQMIDEDNENLPSIE